jgi:hypothetical protein
LHCAVGGCSKLGTFLLPTIDYTSVIGGQTCEVGGLSSTVTALPTLLCITGYVKYLILHQEAVASSMMKSSWRMIYHYSDYSIVMVIMKYLMSCTSDFV